jgi:GcrA cell cycle regulator
MFATEPTWTAERIELLKSRFEAGLTCREIAADIGVSRNAVIGKLTRLNLSRADGIGERMPEQARGPGIPPRAPRRRRVSQRQLLRALRPELPPEPELCGEHRCSLLELSEENCRWPISDLEAAVWFCGNPRAKGFAYCAGHARIAYQTSSRWRGVRQA